MVLDANEMASSMFGYSREQFVGSSINMLVPLQHRGQHDAYIRLAFSQNQIREMGSRRAVRGVHSDGHQLELSIHLSPFRLVNAADAPEQQVARGASLMLCVVRDITEPTRLAMSKQRAANRARLMDEFLRLINHGPPSTRTASKDRSPWFSVPFLTLPPSCVLVLVCRDAHLTARHSPLSGRPARRASAGESAESS